jgi:hypothetical protein
MLSELDIQQTTSKSTSCKLTKSLPLVAAYVTNHCPLVAAVAIVGKVNGDLTFRMA